MGKAIKITLQDYRSDYAPEDGKVFKVVKMVNTTTPRIGEWVTERTVQDWCLLEKYEITIEPIPDMPEGESK